MIELLVAMAIVGLIFALSAVGLRNALDLNLKNGARQLSATLRFLQNLAVTRHARLRLVYDLGKQVYWVEESSEAFVISRTEKEDEAPKEEEPPDAAKEAPSDSSPFTRSELKLLKERPLPSGVYFKDVVLGYRDRKQEQGQAATYFFPDGYATETVIHLRDSDDEDYFSVHVQPLTGRVTVEEGYREAEGAEAR